MENQEEFRLKIPKWNLLVVGGFTILIVLIGIFLVDTKWNEGLYANSTTIRSIFGLITEFGSEYFYITFFVIAYIGINKIFAQRLMLNFAITHFFVFFIKGLFQDPRPHTNTVEGEPVEESYGFPSGHTANAVAVWGYTDLSSQKLEHKTVRIVIQWICGAFMILIPLSRMIIGVHDLEDVVGGYLIGIVVLMVFIPIQPKISQKDKSYKTKLIIYVSSAFLLWVIGILILVLLHPETWPEEAESLGLSGGMMLGMAISVPLEMEFIKYDASHYSRQQRILGCILAIVITFGLYFGLSYLLGDLPAQYIMRALRYMLLMGVFGLAMPWMMVKIFPKKKTTEI